MYKFRILENGLGEIQIDDFRESFESDYGYWSRANYEAQWADASNRLREGKPACFITSVTDPKNTNFVRSWVCYPIGDELAFQEHILFLDELGESFDPTDPHKHILQHEAVTEEGEMVSEWRTGV